MDEDRQAQIAGGGVNLDMVKRASGQHQPPIDYYLEAIGLALFGYTEMGARIHAAVMGSLSVLLLFLLLQKNLRENRLVYTSVVLFLFDVFHIRYSQEGRPIATGVFCSLLYVIAVFNLMARYRSRRRFILDILFLLLANLLLMLSVGFQPFPFLLASSLALIPGLFIESMRWRIVIVWLVAVLSVLISYPIISLSISEGAPYIDKKSLFERVVALADAASAIGKATWTGKLKRLYDSYTPMTLLLAIPGVLGIIRYWIEKRADKPRLFSIYTILFIAVFPPVFDLLYNSQISYRMTPRYYAVYQPMLFLSLSVLLFFAFDLIKSLAPVISRWSTLLLFISFSILFSIALVKNGELLKKEYRNHSKTAWRELYALFKEEGERGDAAYMMNLKPFNRWTPTFSATRFYYEKNSGRTVSLNNANRLIRDYKRDRLKRTKSVFIVTAYGHDNLEKKAFADLEKITLYEFPKLSVIKVTDVQRTGDIKDAFEIIKTKLKHRPDNYRVFYILANMLIHDGELEEAKSVVERLSLMDRKNDKFQKNIVNRLMKSIRKRETKE